MPGTVFGFGNTAEDKRDMASGLRKQHREAMTKKAHGVLGKPGS